MRRIFLLFFLSFALCATERERTLPAEVMGAELFSRGTPVRESMLQRDDATVARIKSETEARRLRAKGLSTLPEAETPFGTTLVPSSTLASAGSSAGDGVGLKRLSLSTAASGGLKVLPALPRRSSDEDPLLPPTSVQPEGKAGKAAVLPSSVASPALASREEGLRANREEVKAMVEGFVVSHRNLRPREAHAPRRYDPKLGEAYGITEQDYDDFYDRKTLSQVATSGAQEMRKQQGVKAGHFLSRYVVAKSNGRDLPEHNDFRRAVDDIYAKKSFDDDMSHAEKEKFSEILWWLYLGNGQPAKPEAFVMHFLQDAVRKGCLDWFLQVSVNGVQSDELLEPFLEIYDAEYVGMPGSQALQKKSAQYFKHLRAHVKEQEAINDREVPSVVADARTGMKKEFADNVETFVNSARGLESSSEAHKRAMMAVDTTQMAGVLAEQLVPTMSAFLSQSCMMLASNMQEGNAQVLCSKASEGLKAIDADKVRTMSSSIQMVAAATAHGAHWHSTKANARDVMSGVSVGLATLSGVDAPTRKSVDATLSLSVVLDKAAKDPSDPSYLVIEDHANNWKHILWASLKNAASTGYSEILFTVADKKLQKTQLQQMAILLTQQTLDNREDVPHMARDLVTKMQDRALSEDMGKAEFAMLAASAYSMPRRVYRVILSGSER